MIRIELISKYYNNLLLGFLVLRKLENLLVESTIRELFTIILTSILEATIFTYYLKY